MGGSQKSSGLSRIVNLNPLKKLFYILLFAALTLPLQAISVEKLESAKVLKVVDGDTLKVRYKGIEESVRLIGIDAPESRPNKKARNDAQRSGEDLKTITAMGKEATSYAKSLVKPGDTVKMEFDVQKRDKYGRLLAYVYLSNGKMLNEETVKAGYANLMTVPPNVKYQGRVLKAYREARESREGLWR
jgi:micrococcal nuclease